MKTNLDFNRSELAKEYFLRKPAENDGPKERQVEEDEDAQGTTCQMDASSKEMVVSGLERMSD